MLNGIIVLLIADLIWQLAKAYIEFRLELTGHGSSADELARNGRLRTLLPIFRNALAVFIAVVAVLTILAGLGVQIMPLIAGAGIFGVAIGFGSQTLVKDILSRRLLHARRRLPGRRIHPERQLQGHCRIVQLALGAAAASSRSGVHGPVRHAGRGPEHEPRLGDGEDHA